MFVLLKVIDSCIFKLDDAFNLYLLDTLKYSMFHISESDMNFLMKLAINTVVYVSFVTVFDKWRWGVFRGDITQDHYTRNFWKYK